MEEDRGIIRLTNISYKYPGGKQALKNVNFILREKEKVGLIGPNGSGKTTLFHVIMGLLKPQMGDIEIFGKKMEKERDFQGVRDKIGMLFQDSDDQLFSPTVLEDVAFGPLNQGKSVDEAKKIARETLNTLGLRGFENRLTYKLSGGEKRLVSLATVLAMRPKVLLLDEPTTGLDQETIERITHILRDIDISYVLISHNMDFLGKTTQKVYGMTKGILLKEKEKVPHTHVHTHDFGEFPHTHTDDYPIK